MNIINNLQRKKRVVFKKKKFFAFNYNDLDIIRRLM